ncbi:hypothetical protein [Leptolyngbya ohadii]|uniref:hypothetical protein n=1 Tax=Leptolyngbya ohadii TaxID=1962290 RepID=UPI00117A33B2|nr:hypothetical protein [Leptolyngbya ohadii]
MQSRPYIWVNRMGEPKSAEPKSRSKLIFSFNIPGFCAVLTGRKAVFLRSPRNANMTRLGAILTNAANPFRRSAET